MTWYDDRLVASLGGIPLHYRQVDTDAGRRTVVHEFYGSSRKPYVEDIGPVTWRATIDVFLVGLNYHVVRQDLIDILDSPGPHEFIHPLRGSFMVRLGSPARLSETVAEGGMVRIGQLELVEAGESFPLVVLSSTKRLVSMSFEVADVLAATSRLNIDGAIDPTVNGLVAAMRRAAALIRKANARVASVTNRVSGITNRISQFEQSVDRLLNSPYALFSEFANLGLEVFNALGQFEFASRTIEVEEPVFPVVSTATASVNDFTSFTTEPDTAAWVPFGPQQELAVEGHGEIQYQAQTLGVVACAGIAGQLPYASAAEAGTVLKLLSDGLAQSMASPGLDSQAHRALAELRTTVIRHLIDRKAKLPQIVKITTPATMPAVVLAWELYGDATRARELSIRNKTPNPNYFPGGTVLEVQQDA